MLIDSHLVICNTQGVFVGTKVTKITPVEVEKDCRLFYYARIFWWKFFCYCLVGYTLNCEVEHETEHKLQAFVKFDC